MKISFSTLGCPKWGWDKILDEAVRMGYDGIEIRGIEGEMNIGQLMPFLPENIEKTIDQLREKHLEICCLDTSCRFDVKETYDRNLQEGREAIDIARKLGCKYVRVFGDNISDKADKDGALRQIASGISELGEYAKDKGVNTLIETHGDFATGDAMLGLLNHITSQNVAILWDAANGYIEKGESVEFTFNKLSGYIKHTHLKDAVGTPPNTKHCLFGQGVISVDEILKLLKSIGYDGWLSLEWEKMWIPELEEPEIAFDVYISKIKSRI